MYRENYNVKKRALVYIFGLTILSSSVYFITKADVGMPPIIGLPFVLSKATGLSLGLLAFFANMGYLLIQVLILRERFPKKEIFQIAAAFLFSFFVDLMSFLLAFVFIPATMPQRIFSFILGLMLASLGVSMVSLSRFFMIPCDAVSRVISKEIGKDFGKTKVVVDSSVVFISAFFSLLLLKRLEGVNIGTPIVAFSIGNIVSFFLSKFTDKVEAFIGFEPVLKEEIA